MKESASSTKAVALIFVAIASMVWGSLEITAKAQATAPGAKNSTPKLATVATNGVSGKTYVNSDGDTIAFHDHGKATETNGEVGTMYSYQSAIFGANGLASSDCTYSQDRRKIALTCEGATPQKVVFTVNEDGSLTGPPAGMYGHQAFAHLIEKNKNQSLTASSATTGTHVGTIYDAAESGDLPRVTALLKANPDLVFRKEKDKENLGRTPLHWAAWAGHKDVARLLLANKADVNAKDNFGGTPLHDATINGHKDVAMLLLANKADINAKADDSSTPLQMAARYLRKDVVELLLANKADVNAKDNRGDTPLNSAINPTDGDHYGVVKLLLANGAEVNIQNDTGDTPLHSAALYQYMDVVELLLASKADINARDNFGFTPLHVASFRRDSEVAKLLRQHGGLE